jgi:hypothetical protein
MPIAAELASSSARISSGIALIAVFLGLRQWYEWRSRSPALSDVDRGHFWNQDLRRGLGVAVMLVLALGLYFGSRMPHKVAGRANLAFVEIWLAIVALIVVLLVLALFDLVSTRSYAQRQRRSIARERQRMLRDALQKGHTPPADRPPDSHETSD